MELQDLKQSVSDLGDDDLRSLLATIRQSRRTSKRPPPSEKKASSAPKSSVSAETLMAGLTKEQAEMFLAMMEKGGKTE